MNDPVPPPQPEEKRSALGLFGKFLLWMFALGIGLSVLLLGTCFLLVNLR